MRLPNPQPLIQNLNLNSCVIFNFYKWAWRDLNSRHLAYKTSALTSLSYKPAIRLYQQIIYWLCLFDIAKLLKLFHGNV